MNFLNFLAETWMLGPNWQQNGWSLSSTQICRKRHIDDTKLPDYYIETSPVIYGANRWYDFYIMSTLEWNKLILTTTFSLYYFFLSWTNPLSPSVQPNQTYFWQKHKTQNANRKFSQQLPQPNWCSFER